MMHRVAAAITDTLHYTKPHKDRATENYSVGHGTCYPENASETAKRDYEDVGAGTLLQKRRYKQGDRRTRQIPTLHPEVPPGSKRLNLHPEDDRKQAPAN